jgi:hypothetical protein
MDRFLLDSLNLQRLQLLIEDLTLRNMVIS